MLVSFSGVLCCCLILVFYAGVFYAGVFYSGVFYAGVFSSAVS